METEQATDMLDQLPPEVAPYVIVAVIIWWLTRATYKDSSQGHARLLDRYEARFKQLEQAVERAEAAEDRCTERMEQLERRYERRIEELEREIDQLRVELSEPIAVEQL